MSHCTQHAKNSLQISSGCRNVHASVAKAQHAPVWGMGVMRSEVVLLQLVVIHDPFEGRPILRVGRIDTGQRVGELVGILGELHRRPIWRCGRQQLAVHFECFRQAVEAAEPGLDGY